MSPGAGQPAALCHGKLLSARAVSRGKQPSGFPVQTQARGPAESRGKWQSIPIPEKKRTKKKGRKSWKTQSELVSAGVVGRNRIHHPRPHTSFGKNTPRSPGTTTKRPRQAAEHLPRPGGTRSTACPRCLLRGRFPSRQAAISQPTLGEKFSIAKKI